MKRATFRCSVAVAVFLCVLLPAQAGSLEGRWRLVEETYGAGQRNLVREEASQTIEFVREGTQLEGRTRIGPGMPELRDWPSFVIGETAAPLTVHEKLIRPGEDGIRVRYEVAAFRDDDMRLDVVEEYSLSDDGRSMTGTVTVTFLRGSESRGSFVLHRKFEKQP